MIYFHEELNKILKGRLSVRRDKVILKPQGKSQMIIPSKMLPLANPKTIQLLFRGNTIGIEKDDPYYSLLKEGFDKADLTIGKCFDNVEQLLKIYEEAGMDMSLLQVYNGWMFRYNDTPVNHCILTYKGQSVIDYSISQRDALEGLSEEDMRTMTLDDFRQMTIDKLLKEDKEPSSTVKTFGEIPFPYVFVGSEGSVNEGFEVLKRLVDEFPEHPLIGNLKPVSPLQEAYYAQAQKK